MKNSWKRVASGVLALAIVASNVTANVEWGGLLDSVVNNMSAKAETKQIALNQTYSVGDIITNNNDEPVYFRDSHVPYEADNIICISKGGSLTVSSIYYSAGEYGYKWMLEFTDYTDHINNVDARISTNMAATYEGESYYTVRSLKIKSGTGTESDPFVFGLGDYDTNLRDITDEHVLTSSVFDYTGSAKEPVLKWVDGGTETTLVKGTDYTIEAITDNENGSVDSAKDAGVYHFTIKGKGQYAGSDAVRQVDLLIEQATTQINTDNYEMLNGSYNNTDQNLVTLKENATSIVNIGTAQYAVGEKAEQVIGNDSGDTYNITTSNISVDYVYNPEGIGGFNFPAGYSLKVGDTTYEPIDEQTSLHYYKNGDDYALASKKGGLSWIAGTVNPEYPGTNSFVVTGIDNDNKIITGKFVYYKYYGYDYRNYYITPDSWSDTIPTAKDAGEYPVFVKVDADANGNYSALAPTYLGTATIAPVTPSVKDNKNLKYDGTAQDLVTAPEGAGIKYATTEYNVIKANSVFLSASNIKVNNIYKPTDTTGIYFPVGYSLKIGETTHSISNNDYIYLADTTVL